MSWRGRRCRRVNDQKLQRQCRKGLERAGQDAVVKEEDTLVALANASGGYTAHHAAQETDASLGFEAQSQQYHAQ